ncbi:hypothetical protein C2S52_013111 [Perilla frutescens var. hirtella]|nr:hypothetical protein C2S52_013111 [Perilla frutescens var. hirtella]
MVTFATDSTTATLSTYPSTTSGNSLVCHRHGVGERYISETDANPFRQFVRCPERKVTSCDFFRWVDDELTSHYLTSVQRMKQHDESLESQLQCKTHLTEVLIEKIKVKDEELNRLKREYDSHHTKKTAAKTSKPFICSLVATCAIVIIALLMINDLI